MTNYAVGHKAEQIAANYLSGEGFEITELNWKTPRCEIDIVALKGETVYFIECKYRKTSFQGTGFDYVTPKKLQQMQFAASVWVHKHQFRGPYCLAAIELGGEPVRVYEFVEL